MNNCRNGLETKEEGYLIFLLKNKLYIYIYVRVCFSLTSSFLQYEAGEGAQYVSRKAAMRMLQLSLKNFRKLCILKGIYPREPRNRKRAQKGASGIKTLYHKKDIQFLMHEPIIWKLRDLKV